ncbi:MAG: hypothetical protein L7F78_15655, partial [Syntrophales bacterium LBB04]|nr:hypothetical protein [Syntrophales bacterium LBB04]
MHNLERFESRLKLQRPADLAELNCWALDWCIYANGVPLMRGVAPRSALWSYITQEQLRLCPEEEYFRQLIREPIITRTADGSCHISVDGAEYAIPDSDAAGKKVTVVRHPYERPAVEVHFNGFVWLCQPIPVDQYGRLTDGVTYGEYQAPKKTVTQKAQTEMEQIAEGWGLTWKGAGEKRRAEAPPAGQLSPLAVFGHQAEKVGNLEFIEKKGTPLDIRQPDLPENAVVKSDAATVSRGIANRLISFGEFLKSVRQEIGVVTPDLNRDLREQYCDGIGIKEAEEVIRAIQEGAWSAQQ